MKKGFLLCGAIVAAVIMAGCGSNSSPTSYPKAVVPANYVPDSSKLPTNGLLVYYPFTGNANDYSGNGYDGTAVGAVLTNDRFGNANSAYSFNGSNSYVAIPNIVQSSDSEFTISLWCYGGTANGMIYYQGTQNGEFDIRDTNGYCSFGIKLSNANWYIATGVQLNAQRWYHLVGVYVRGNNLALWVNGTMSMSRTLPNLSLFVCTPYALSSIGAYDRGNGIYASIGGGHWWNGLIDDIRIYSRALDPAEIQTLYQDGGW